MNQAADSFSVEPRLKGFDRAFRLVRLCERIYAVGAFAIVAGQIVKSDSGMKQFLILWALVAIASMVTVLLPRAPRPAAIFAEAFLGVLVIGHFIADHPQWIPVLNRISIVSENLPLAQRRFLAWNMICGLALAWVLVPYGFFHANHHLRTWKRMVGIIGIVVLSAMMLLLFGAVAFSVLNL